MRAGNDLHQPPPARRRAISTAATSIATPPHHDSLLAADDIHQLIWCAATYYNQVTHQHEKMSTFTEAETAASSAGGVVAVADPMDEVENKAPAEAAKDAAKVHAPTPGADGKPTEMTRYVWWRHGGCTLDFSIEL